MAKKKPVQTGCTLEAIILNDHPRNLDIFFRENLSGDSEGQRLRQAILDMLRGHARAHVEAEQVTQDRRKRGGKATAEQKGKDVQDRNNQIVNKARLLLKDGHDRHELAGILSPRCGLSPRQIRDILKTAGI